MDNSLLNKFKFQSLTSIVNPVSNNESDLKISSFDKYKDQIVLNDISSKDAKIQELITNNNQLRTEFLLDLICENIVPSLLSKEDGIVIVVDCGYKWVETSFEQVRNTSSLKIMHNMEKYCTDNTTEEAKKQYLKKLIIIDAYENLENSMDSVLLNLRKLLQNLDKYISFEIDNLSRPLNCIILDNVELLYWEMRDGHQLHSKFKELYQILLDISKSFNCKVLISRMDYRGNF